jgi:hypothetical protein
MDDDEIMLFLREVLDFPSTAPIPSDRAIEQAVTAGRWVRIDEEFAELLADSADDPVLAGVRGPAGGARMMTYRFDDLTLQCEVGSEGLWGQVGAGGAPPGVALELVTPDGAATPLQLDAYGRFMETQLPAGPVCIRCIRAGGPRAMTPWFVA